MTGVAAAPDAALRVVLTIRIEPGQEAAFEELWRSHAETVGRFPANRGQQLLRERGEVGSYTVVTDWTDEPAFRAFEQSPEQQRYLKELWAIRAGGGMQLLDPLFARAPGAAGPAQRTDSTTTEAR